MRHPKQVEGLIGKKVVEVCVGAVHTVAVTEEGEVYTWGTNDQGQLGDPSLPHRSEPTLMAVLEGKNIVGCACGPSQVSHDFLKG